MAAPYEITRWASNDTCVSDDTWPGTVESPLAQFIAGFSPLISPNISPIPSDTESIISYGPYEHSEHFCQEHSLKEHSEHFCQEHSEHSLKEHGSYTTSSCSEYENNTERKYSYGGPYHKDIIKEIGNMLRHELESIKHNIKISNIFLESTINNPESYLKLIHMRIKKERLEDSKMIMQKVIGDYHYANNLMNKIPDYQKEINDKLEADYDKYLKTKKISDLEDIMKFYKQAAEYICCSRERSQE